MNGEGRGFPVVYRNQQKHPTRKRLTDGETGRTSVGLRTVQSTGGIRVLTDPSIVDTVPVTKAAAIRSDTPTTEGDS